MFVQMPVDMDLLAHSCFQLINFPNVLLTECDQPQKLGGAQPAETEPKGLVNQLLRCHFCCAFVRVTVVTTDLFLGGVALL